MDELVLKTIDNLKAHNMAVFYVKDGQELLTIIDSLIKPDETVGCGDSMTLEDLGVFEYLQNSKAIFLDKHDPQLTSSDKRKIYLNNFSADTFISGVNAISQQGNLFFIDGNGSRIAPIIYGPNQVILVTGTNKIAATDEEAEIRTRQIAAPLDARRLGKKTPCAITGECIDCKSPERICNSFLKISRQFTKDRIKVILIEGEYGY